MRVVYWARIDLAREALIEALSDIEQIEFRCVENLEALLVELPGAEGLILADAPIASARQVTQRLAAENSTVKWMHFISAGMEGFVAAGIPAKVRVTNVPGASASSVAEHAMALLLTMTRRMYDSILATVRLEWSRGDVSKLRSLEDQNVVVVGLGHVGRAICARASAFGAHVQGVSRSTTPLNQHEAFALRSLDSLLPSADVVILAIALTDETFHLFDTARLQKLKRGALLVNVSRGNVIDQTALRVALEDGTLAGAAIDVADPEPLPKCDPLWGAPNLIVTAHLAAQSPTTVKRLVAGTIANLADCLGGNLLNTEPLQHERP